MGVATLTYLPFPSHHLAPLLLVREDRHLARVRRTIGIWFVFPQFGFDVLFFFMAGYSMSSWIMLAPDERVAYGRAVADAKVLARAQRPANRAGVARELHKKHEAEPERARAVADKDPVEAT